MADFVGGGDKEELKQDLTCLHTRLDRQNVHGFAVEMG